MEVIKIEEDKLKTLHEMQLQAAARASKDLKERHKKELEEARKQYEDAKIVVLSYKSKNIELEGNLKATKEKCYVAEESLKALQSQLKSLKEQFKDNIIIKENKHLKAKLSETKQQLEEGYCLVLDLTKAFEKGLAKVKVDMGAELSHRSNTRTLKGLVSVTDAVLKSNRFTAIQNIQLQQKYDELYLQAKEREKENNKLEKELANLNSKLQRMDNTRKSTKKYLTWSLERQREKCNVEVAKNRLIERKLNNAEEELKELQREQKQTEKQQLKESIPKPKKIEELERELSERAAYIECLESRELWNWAARKEMQTEINKLAKELKEARRSFLTRLL